MNNTNVQDLNSGQPPLSSPSEISPGDNICKNPTTWRSKLYSSPLFKYIVFGAMSALVASGISSYFNDKPDSLTDLNSSKSISKTTNSNDKPTEESIPIPSKFKAQDVKATLTEPCLYERTIVPNEVTKYSVDGLETGIVFHTHKLIGDKGILMIAPSLTVKGKKVAIANLAYSYVYLGDAKNEAERKVLEVKAKSEAKEAFLKFLKDPSSEPKDYNEQRLKENLQRAPEKTKRELLNSLLTKSLDNAFIGAKGKKDEYLKSIDKIAPWWDVIQNSFNETIKEHNLTEERKVSAFRVLASLLLESGSDMHAVSGAGAAGIVQFLKGTAIQYKIPINVLYDGRFEPETAIAGYVRYMSHLAVLMSKEKYKPDNIDGIKVPYKDIDLATFMALLGYNQGEGTVINFMDKLKDRTMLDLYYELLDEKHIDGTNYSIKFFAISRSFVVISEERKTIFKITKENELEGHKVVRAKDGEKLKDYFPGFNKLSAKQQEIVRKLNPGIRRFDNLELTFSKYGDNIGVPVRIPTWYQSALSTP